MLLLMPAYLFKFHRFFNAVSLLTHLAPKGDTARTLNSKFRQQYFIFLLIAEGAVSLMEVENKDYGRSSGVTDPFGNVWWITSVTEK